MHWIPSAEVRPFTTCAFLIIGRLLPEIGTWRSVMNSVGNVARVLRRFAPDRSVLSVTEVAQLLALPKSSSSRLLKAMAETGLLATTEQPSGYCVGNLIFETSRRHRV